MIRFPSLSALGAAAALSTMLAAPAAYAGIEEGIQAVRNQKFDVAQKEFESLAAKDAPEPCITSAKCTSRAWAARGRSA